MRYDMTIRRFFQLVYGLFFLLIFAIGVVAALLVVNQESLKTSQRVRLQSYLVADELRQSSDDLTRFARTYVVTGDPRFEKYYWDVLAIRNGREPRPAHYERIYWDLVAATGRAPRPAGKPIPLQGLMVKLGFTEAEFEKLKESQGNSDALVKTENTAMHAMKGLYDDGKGEFTRRGKPDQAMAIRIMHDQAYHREKAKIMKPIDDFFALLGVRTASTMERYARRSTLFLESIIAMLLTLLALSLVSSIIIGRRVTAPVAVLEAQTEVVAADIDRLAGVAKRISQGNLSEMFTTTARQLDIRTADEIGQLAQMHNHMVTCLQEAGESIAEITTDLGVKNALLQDAKEVAESAHRDLQDSYTRLRELESLRDSLTHMIVHDMRTPLTGIAGYLETLRTQEADRLSDDGREFLDVAMSSAQNLIEMVSSLLDISKMEHGEMRLEVSEFDLARAAEDVLAKLESLRAQRRIVLNAPSDPVFVSADAGLISRVIQNLVSNGLKFTSEDGEITVAVQPEDNGVRVSVSDNGPGIPEEYRERIFDKFGQVEARAQRRQYSTGLGLTFCKLAVEAHGGRIGVDSQEGKGSTFWFVLPGEGTGDRV